MSIKFGILGIGKMGSATLEGVLASNAFEPSDVYVYDSIPEALEVLKGKGVNAVTSAEKLLEAVDVFLIAVKPQSFDAVEKLSSVDCSAKAIISFAPGKSIEYLEGIFKGALITRAMPNTPALISEATATLYTNNKGNVDLLKYVKMIFGSIGTYEFLPNEGDIDLAIPLNGSMPAYIFSFIKEFVECGKERGINPQTALNLCVNSVIGSCKLLLKSGEKLETLINNVCSKGGTTIAGLDKLYQNGFKDSIQACYRACSERSIELGKGDVK